MSTLTHLIKSFTLWEIVKSHMPVLCSRRFWLFDADEVCMMMRALMLLFAFSGATAVHAETVEYGHKLSCEVVKKYEDNERYQSFRQVRGLKSANHEPSQGTWEISFNPSSEIGLQRDDYKAAIKVDWGDDNVQSFEATLIYWHHNPFVRGKLIFSMRLLWPGIELFDSLRVSSDMDTKKAIDLYGFYHVWSPHVPPYTIRYSGSCRIVTGHL